MPSKRQVLSGLSQSKPVLSHAAPSTVGRKKNFELTIAPAQTLWHNETINLHYGDSLNLYQEWDSPTMIISDGAYGVLGFDGDPTNHQDLPDWYEPHIQAWTERALPWTTLWFWNSEIGWAAVHPVLERYGWRYVGTNIWDKGKAHIAGNVNTKQLRQFPVVTELCVQYVFDPKINGLSLKQWLLYEWRRTGLALREANRACGVADAATRKYLNQGHLWYFPPPERFELLVEYANIHGDVAGRPYFSIDGIRPATATEWATMRAKFYCPYGFTNVWQRDALRNAERIKTPQGKVIHLNQKPLDLMERIIAASSDPDDVIWEPFGGLFSGALAAHRLKRRAYAAEIDSTYYLYGVERFNPIMYQQQLL